MDSQSRMIELGVRYDAVYTDDWAAFANAFKADNHIVGKENTVGIEGSNCRLRHRASIQAHLLFF